MLQVHVEFSYGEKVECFEESWVESSVTAVCGSGAWGVDE
jgi:hypothetical protein